jgi:hypothetical protein
MILSIMALIIMTLIIMTLIIMTLIIMTLSIMTLSIIMLSILILSIMTRSIMTQSIMTLRKETKHSDTTSQYFGKILTLSYCAYALFCLFIVMQSVVIVMLNVMAPREERNLKAEFFSSKKVLQLHFFSTNRQRF